MRSNILSDFLKILILRGKILKKKKKLSKILKIDSRKPLFSLEIGGT